MSTLVPNQHIRCSDIVPVTVLGVQRPTAKLAKLVQHKEASSSQMQEGTELAAGLREAVRPYFLRREKKGTVMVKVQDRAAAQGAEVVASSAPPMPPKNEVIVWLSLHPFQRVLYMVRVAHYRIYGCSLAVVYTATMIWIC